MPQLLSVKEIQKQSILEIHINLCGKYFAPPPSYFYHYRFRTPSHLLKKNIILIWHPHPLIQPLCINSSRFRKFLIAFAKQSILESSSNVAKTNWRHAAEWTGVQTPSKPIAPLPPYFNHCASAPLSSGNSWLLLRSKAFRKAIPNVAENIWRLFAP